MELLVCAVLGRHWCASLGDLSIGDGAERQLLNPRPHNGCRPVPATGAGTRFAEYRQCQRALGITGGWLQLS